jgi:hypothetical protein
MKISSLCRLALVTAVFFAAVILSQSLYAQTAKEVGYIESFTNKTSNYAIERNNTQYPVQIFTTVFAGDRIIIIPDEEENPDHLEIILRIGNNKKQTISLDQSPFVVPDTVESVSISKNLLSWLKDFFLLLPEEDISRVVTMTVRGETIYNGPPSFILISKDENTTAQFGHPLLHIEWTGGMPPFEFDMFQQEENVIALGSHAMGTDSLINCLVRSSNAIVKHQYRVHQLKLHADQLTVGKYVIYLSDAIGNVVVGQVEIIPRGAGALSMEVENAPKHLTPLVTLASALKNGRKELLFDARQLIGDFSDADYPTRLLGRKLICQSIQERSLQ